MLRRWRDDDLAPFAEMNADTEVMEFFPSTLSRAESDAFWVGGFDRIVSFTTETNVRSRAVMERIGLSRRPDLDFDHPRLPDWWGRRHVVYGITRDAWSRAQELTP